MTPQSPWMRKWATVSHCVPFSCPMTWLLKGKKGQGTRKVGSWDLKLGSKELLPSPYPKFILARRLLSPTLRKRNIASSRDEMLSKQIAGQSLPLLPLPRSHLCIFVRHPRCLSHALCGEQGGYAGCRHGECSSADVSCLWQAKGKGVVWGTVWKSGQTWWFPPFFMNWDWQNCSWRENNGTAHFGEVGCRYWSPSQICAKSFLMFVQEQQCER